ncbi:MAG: BglII/BstYI family type II restriction endonuclease [Chitinophagaceae bacterium]
MQYEVYQHRSAQKIIPSVYQQQVLKAITSATAKKPISTQKIRRSIMDTLHYEGWSDEIRIAPTSSKIDITSMKGDVGLCFQTGNMSRFYADILKLQTLFAERKIKGSICIVPKRAFARSFGQNIVNFERFVRELTIFSKTITVPILIYGIEE